MTATANRSKASTSVLSPIANKVSETVIMLMQYFGIKKIEVKKLRSSEFERVIAEIRMFDGTPQELVSCGFLVKDSLAEIMAAAGIVHLEVSETDEERSVIVKNFSALVDKFKTPPISVPIKVGQAEKSPESNSHTEKKAQPEMKLVTPKSCKAKKCSCKSKKRT